MKLGDEHDFTKYTVANTASGSHYSIPFSEIIPADFEDVHFKLKDGSERIGYYSPAHHHIETCDHAWDFIDLKDCDYWLKPVVTSQ